MDVVHGCGALDGEAYQHAYLEDQVVERFADLCVCEGANHKRQTWYVWHGKATSS